MKYIQPAKSQAINSAPQRRRLLKHGDKLAAKGETNAILYHDNSAEAYPPFVTALLQFVNSSGTEQSRQVNEGIHIENTTNGGADVNAQGGRFQVHKPRCLHLK